MAILRFILFQLIAWSLLVFGAVFAYGNREPVSVALPFIITYELPLWLVCFAFLALGFLSATIIGQFRLWAALWQLMRRKKEAAGG